MRRAAISSAERVSGQIKGSREVTVGFADLVGLTRLGERLPADELGHVAARLEKIAVDVARPPVRLVKIVGDSVMLASTDSAALVTAGLGLIAAADAEGEEFPSLRAGIACGMTLSRGGDWYGRPVNLASRVVSVARPGSVLVTRDVRNAVKDDFAWSAAGQRRLKGVDKPIALYRARPLEVDEPPQKP